MDLNIRAHDDQTFISQSGHKVLVLSGDHRQRGIVHVRPPHQPPICGCETFVGNFGETFAPKTSVVGDFGKRFAQQRGDNESYKYLHL